MKLSKDLNKILTSGSLIILALGFAALGLLSFNNYHAAEVANISSDHVLSTIGSLSSILVGVIFLVAVCLYWSRYARILRSPDSNAL